MSFSHDLGLTLPELILAGSAMLLLIWGACQPKAGVVFTLAAMAALAAAAWAAATGPLGRGFSGGMVADQASAFSKVAIYVASAVCIPLGQRWFERRDVRNFEFPILILLAALGMGMMTSAGDLISLYVGVELQSLALYVLAAMHRDNARASEAGLKYFVLGALSSGLLLYGASLIYGFSGSTLFPQIAASVQSGAGTGVLFGLVFLICGLAFKVSAAPFHMWTPDVYEGAPTPVTGFMAAATKTVALVLTLRLLNVAFPEKEDVWTIAVAFLACASLAWGNLAALVQTRVKRLLAYSSISHAGFMLIAIAAHNLLGARALLYYLIPYSAISIGAFAVVAARERELGETVTLDNLAGFVWERPWLGWPMVTFMFGFAGFPLTGGFMGKFLIFSAASEADQNWLVLVGVAATLLSLYYYLAVIRAMLMRPAAELGLAPIGGSPPRDVLLTSAAVTAMIVNIGAFFTIQPLVDLTRTAAEALPL